MLVCSGVIRCRHGALGCEGGEGGGEGCQSARAASARHGCRGRGCPGGQGQGYRGGGRAQGEQVAEAGRRDYHRESRGAAAALPADPQQHLRGEQQAGAGHWPPAHTHPSSIA